MGRQLSLFRDAVHLFASVDSKNQDFIMYNALNYDFTGEEIKGEDLEFLTYKEMTPTIQKLKSEAWSSGCKWFFVLQDEGIYLMNVYSDIFVLCRKHSKRFIEMYLQTEVKG